MKVEKHLFLKPKNAKKLKLLSEKCGVSQSFVIDVLMEKTDNCENFPFVNTIEGITTVQCQIGHKVFDISGKAKFVKEIENSDDNIYFSLRVEK